MGAAARHWQKRAAWFAGGAATCACSSPACGRVAAARWQAARPARQTSYDEHVTLRPGQLVLALGAAGRPASRHPGYGRAEAHHTELPA
jgi:hypothetical protein